MHAIVPKPIVKVIEAVRLEGGHPFVVGGAVRDALLGIPVTTKDLDFEVYNLKMDALMSVLSRFGNVNAVGRSFGVIKLWMKHEGEVDFSLPRRESKTGFGHRGFLVDPDPSMTPKEACARRDFTLNAILMDPADGGTLDFFDGIKDLKNNVLRHTSAHFTEDPLRPLRAMQLCSRFCFSIHPDTAKLCASMVEEATALPKERIFGEWEKWALKSAFPSKGLLALAEMGWLSVFPELSPLMQKETLHRRLIFGADQANRIAEKDRLERNDRLVLLVAAICRDMNPKASEGFWERIGLSPKLVKRVSLLVEEARRFDETGFPSDKEILQSAVRLETDSIAMLARLLATASDGDVPSRRLLANATALGVETHPPLPLLLGRDLVEQGIFPGKEMGRLLQAAFDAQLTGAFKTKEEAARWLLSQQKKL